MLNTNTISPYVRSATKSTLVSGLVLKERAIFDYELIWIREGGFTLQMNGKTYKTKPNDLILIPPGVNHTISVSPNDPPSVDLHIHFDMIYTDCSPEAYVSYKNLKKFTGKELKMIQPDFFEGQFDYPYFEIGNYKKLTATIEEIITFFHNKPALYQLTCKSLMIEIIRSIIFDNIHEPNVIMDSVGGDFISSVKSFVDANYLNSKISLDSIAEQFHYSKYYIIKKFHSTYGISLIKYCNERRVEYAKRKLAEGISASRVGELLFFPDLYSFSISR